MNALAPIPGLAHAACTIGICSTSILASQPREPESARGHIPASVLVGGVVLEGGELVDGFRELARRPDIRPLIDAAFKGNPELTKARIGMLAFAGSAGMDPWTAARTIAGREIAFGIVPRPDGEPGFIAAILPEDPDALARLVTGAQALLGLRGVKPEIHEVAGHSVTVVAPAFMYSQVGPTLILSNNQELLSESLGGGPRLSDAGWFARDRGNVDAYGAIDMSRLRALGSGLPEQSSNPLGGLVLGGWLERLRNAQTADLWLDAVDGGMRFGGSVDSDSAWPATHRGFESGIGGAFDIDFSGVRGYLGEITMARDWADLFAQREALLDDAAVGQLVGFSNTLTALLGGLDFADDVLPRVRGPVELIVAGQDFDTLGVEPTPKLPAVAMVAPLWLPEGDPTRKRLMSGGLAALSVVGLEQAQKGQPTLSMEIEDHRGHRIIYAAYSSPDAAGMELGAGGGGMAGAGGARYNAAPTMTIVEDRLIVATSISLTRSIADAILDDGREPPGAGDRVPLPADHLVVRASPVVELLRLNREEMVVDRMLKKDATRAEAEAAVDSLLAVLGLLDSLDASATPDGREFSGRISIQEPAR